MWRGLNKFRPPNQQRRHLPSLLSDSSAMFHMARPMNSLLVSVDIQLGAVERGGATPSAAVQLVCPPTGAPVDGSSAARGSATPSVFELRANGALAEGGGRHAFNQSLIPKGGVRCRLRSRTRQPLLVRAGHRRQLWRQCGTELSPVAIPLLTRCRNSVSTPTRITKALIHSRIAAFRDDNYRVPSSAVFSRRNTFCRSKSIVFFGIRIPKIPWIQPSYCITCY